MLYCPKCGVEISETDNFCKHCGVDLTKFEALPGTPEAAVKAALIQRIDGIKRKSADAILGLVDEERYTKFDDWPPFERQGPESLNREAEAFKVLKEYNYETRDWKTDVFDNFSLASFIIRYQGTIRELRFDVKSRVTVALVKKNGEWKLFHEHWSRLPEGEPQREPRRPRFPWIGSSLGQLTRR